LFFALLLAGGVLGRAQDDSTVTLPDAIQAAKDWAQENLDTNVLAALPAADQQQTEQLLRELQEKFQGEYVVDLAALRQAATVALPLLAARPETQPYAAWLQPRMDYLDVADKLQVVVPPPAAPGQPAPVPSNPPPQREREVWVKEVANRPWPPAARELVPRLKPIFAGEKVPPQLVWLAEVESSFDARARSPDGAAGLFQLMPATAKRFGLSLWPRDERLQAGADTAASAQYLKLLHDRFGDWRLALAAYNCGEGTVQKLLERYKTKSYDDIAVHLPAETQLFVPKVEAVILQREGVSLAGLSSPG
jgi:membrane-bound lytic murein transglycosylase D